VDACHAVLPRTGYHWHTSVCKYHRKAYSVARDAQLMRFCRHCRELHPLLDYDFGKRRATVCAFVFMAVSYKS